MVVISSFLLVHHRKKQVEKKSRIYFIKSYFFVESGLILTASTVVLTDERISHVGDPHAVTISCSHVELVDISSNAFSDWHEVCLLIYFS
jgi:hypothetical protein